MKNGPGFVACLIMLFMCWQVVSCTQKIKHSSQEVRNEMAKVR